MLEYDLSDGLKETIKKLARRDQRRAKILQNKIRQIISSDEHTIGRFKNLRYSMSERMRVHIDKSFVLTFRYYREKKFVFFEDFDHHDNIYRK